MYTSRSTRRARGSSKREMKRAVSRLSSRRCVYVSSVEWRVTRKLAVRKLAPSISISVYAPLGFRTDRDRRTRLHALQPQRTRWPIVVATYSLIRLEKSEVPRLFAERTRRAVPLPVAVARGRGFDDAWVRPHPNRAQGASTFARLDLETPAKSLESPIDNRIKRKL